MSMYDYVVGENNNAETLLAALKKANNNVEFDIPRYRNCYIEKGSIVITTRTGGGNRIDYVDENSALQEVTGYIADIDDDFDSTYAHFYFEIPEELKKQAEFVEKESEKDFSITEEKTIKKAEEMSEKLKDCKTFEEAMDKFKKEVPGVDVTTVNMGETDGNI